MSDDKLDLNDLVDELTRPIRHREHYTVPKTTTDGYVTWYGQDHVTEHPSLLEQLVSSVEQSSSTEAGGGSRPGFVSKPAARLEAIDAAIRIDTDASRWVRELGEDDPGDTAACVQLLHGLSASAPKATLAAITRDVRSWWTQARVLTGWDSPAWKPDNTCPLCGVKGGLRIKLVVKSAVCVECQETWDEDTIGLLADHIRAEAESQHRPGANAMPVGKPCHCKACDPDYQLWVLCPTCARRSDACAKPSDHRFPCTVATRRLRATG